MEMNEKKPENNPVVRRKIPRGLLYTIAGLVVVAVVVIMAVLLPRLFANASVTPSAETDDGYVSANSGFTIAVSGAGTVEALQKRLEVEPDLDYVINEAQGGEYYLYFEKPIEYGTVLTFAVDGREFKFEVEYPLEVVYMFPSPTSSAKVPLDCGIEIEFNRDDVDFEEFKEAFSISPAVEGRFTTSLGRFCFYPTVAYEADRLYTVRLEGLTAPDGQGLKNETVGSFKAGESEDEISSVKFDLYGAPSLNTLLGDAPVLEAAFGLRPDALSAELFAFDSSAQYLEALTRYAQTNDAVIDTSGLNAMGSQEPTLHEAATEYNNNRWIIELAEPLPEGWYAVSLTAELNGERITKQRFLQVSDLSLFYMWVENDLLCWVNDAATGDPVQGASVELAGGYSASALTGAEGTALVQGEKHVEEDSYSARNSIVVEWDDHTFVDTTAFYDYWYESGDASHQYLSYLYTDRPIYQRTDTVEVWGFVKPRSGVGAAQNVELSMGGWYYEEDDEIEKTPVALQADGTFTATLTHEDFSEYGSSVVLWVDGQRLTSAYFTVSNYVKPVTRMFAETGKPLYMAGEEGEIVYTVELYDGTPVPEFGLAMGYDDDKEKGRTDEDGHFAIPFTATAPKDEDSWYPRSESYYVKSVDPDSHSLSAYGYYYYIPRDIMLETSTDWADGESTLQVQTHLVDTSGVEDTDNFWDADLLRGKATDISLKATVTEVYYERTVTGTRYDYINRKTVERIKYVRMEDELATYDFKTNNGTHSLTGLPQASRDGYLYVTITGEDTKGNKLTENVYISSGGRSYSGWYDDGAIRYSLEPLREEDMGESDSEYAYFYKNHSFADGQDIAFQLNENEAPLDKMEGRILYCVAQGGISGVNVTSADTVTLAFDESLVPNYTLSGAYFDGRHIYALDDMGMYFDSSTRALEVDIQPDKQQYAPGDRVNLTINVRNSVSGSAAANTSLVVSVVDEALYSLQHRYQNYYYRDMAAQVYRTLYYPAIKSYTSHQNNTYMSGAEKGGGGEGDEAYRDDFKDTAHFGTLTTGANGTAQMSFLLPDNITEWRVTALGLSPANHVGDNIAGIQATLGYYVSPIISEELVEGDSLVVGLYSAGRGLGASESVEYSLSLKGDGVDESRTVKGTLRGYKAVDFGTLAAGEYTLRVSGSCAKMSDSVQHTVTVAGSGMPLPIVKTFDLEQGIDIQPLRYPVSVRVYDENALVYNRLLRSVQYSAGTSRADARLARRYAAERLQQDGEWYDKTSLTESIRDINGNSLLALLPYDDASIGLTVKAHIAMPHLVKDSALRHYVPQDEEPLEVAGVLAYALLYGSTPERAQFILESDGYGFDDKMYAVMALSLGGQPTQAAEWYDALTADTLDRTQRLDGTELVFADKAGGNRHKNTAAAAMAATALGRESDAKGLVLYLSENPSRYDLYLLEQVYYLETFEPASRTTATFSYTVNGVASSLQTGNRGRTLTLSKEQWESASFSVLSGKAYADVYYTGAPDELDPANENIIVTKTIEPMNGELRVGGLVKVTIKVDYSAFEATEGYPELYLEERVPTGLRFERHESRSNPWGYNDYWWLSAEEGQLLHFSTSPSRYGNNGRLVYYARVATPGTYQVEGTYVASATSAQYGLSDSSTIVIKGEDER